MNGDDLILVRHRLRSWNRADGSDHPRRVDRLCFLGGGGKCAQVGARFRRQVDDGPVSKGEFAIRELENDGSLPDEPVTPPSELCR